ncbi:unnamed protein product [Agarophyton chilense]
MHVLAYTWYLDFENDVAEQIPRVGSRTKQFQTQKLLRRENVVDKTEIHVFLKDVVEQQHKSKRISF